MRRAGRIYAAQDLREKRLHRRLVEPVETFSQQPRTSTPSTRVSGSETQMAGRHFTQAGINWRQYPESPWGLGLSITLQC